MDSRFRAAIATAVAAHSSGRQVRALYDHESQEALPLQADARGARLACHDADIGLCLSGELPNLLRLPERTPIHLLRSEEGDYRGFDHASETHFDVRADGLSVQVFDHGAQRWFAYSAYRADF